MPLALAVTARSGEMGPMGAGRGALLVGTAGGSDTISVLQRGPSSDAAEGRSSDCEREPRQAATST